MNTYTIKALIPALVTAGSIVLAGGALAQTPTPASGSHQESTTSGKSKHHAAASGAHEASGMKAECEAMMAKKHGMQDKMQAMDATLDKLVAEMNAAKDSKATDALEKPMAAVLTELVSQRKAMHSMMEEMHGSGMGHMMDHMKMCSKKGAMQPMTDCPMMKMGENGMKH
ncbi:MAG: hypothetical protein ABIT01_14730 [Thermoanaerobaculia bacterium]